MAESSSKIEMEEDTQIVTPFKVASKNAIDYMKLISRFGCNPIEPSLMRKFELLTGKPIHPWIRRGIFFSHKDFEKILNEYEAGRPIFIYTGRGPSSEALHLGHMIPFWFTKWLQDVFGAIVIIQMSDDEKFSFKGSSDGKDLDEYNRLTYENAKDIIACKFNPEKTFIFSNLRTVGGAMYETITRIDTVTGNQIRGIYDLNLDNTVGQLAWPSKQCAPAFSYSFPDIFHPEGPYDPPTPDGYRKYVGRPIMCLVPMAIDQDPYFRMARDFASKMEKKGYIKPATIHTKFLIPLTGSSGKMSSTGDDVSKSTIYMTDDPEDVRKKIKKFAFSGGRESMELHRTLGADLTVDVAYQYLCYFMNDDEELSRIAHAYKGGVMLSGEIKKIMSDIICDIVQIHQDERSKVNDEVVVKFFNRYRKFDLTPAEKSSGVPDEERVYEKYGINFDIYFGAKAPSDSSSTHEIDASAST
jgi:tryptophanyl-tRNA synthetase